MQLQRGVVLPHMRALHDQMRGNAARQFAVAEAARAVEMQRLEAQAVQLEAQAEWLRVDALRVRADLNALRVRSAADAELPDREDAGADKRARRGW